MINLIGVQQTIEDIEQNGNNMRDLHDLTMLYKLEEYMLKRSKKNQKQNGARLSQEDAERWCSEMKNEDPAKPKGAKWTPDQVKPIATKYGVQPESDRFWELWAIINAMYSDYYVVAKKYNVLSIDYFADLAMAFINDKDSVKNKASVYYECIFEK